MITITADKQPEAFVVGAYLKGADAMLTLIQMWLIEQGGGTIPEIDTIKPVIADRYRRPIGDARDVSMLARQSFNNGVHAAPVVIADLIGRTGTRRKQFLARFAWDGRRGGSTRPIQTHASGASH